jgi:hypothetical protein
LRASHPTLMVAGRALQDRRNAMVKQWAQWISGRASPNNHVPPTLLDRELRLLYDVLTESVGPLRREVGAIWREACEHYGRFGAPRGLAAGEIVEELQYLRELLIRQIGPVLTPLRPRQAMSIILRLNSVLDKGVATAVVGYTDALVATLFTQNGVPSNGKVDASEIERQLEAIEGELATVVRHR